MIAKTCKTCIFWDEYHFCEKLVVDTKRITIDRQSVKSNYIDTREDNDQRSSFITPSTFGCVFHEDKK